MRKKAMWLAIVIVGALAYVSGVLADTEEMRAARAARDWRQAHEHQLLADYFTFLAIPNVSRDVPNIRRNAEFVLNMLKSRGITARLLETSGGNPVVYGEMLTPGATHTYVLYAHYDGQPVDPKAWATPPFEPTLRTGRLDRGGSVIPLPGDNTPVDPNWRVYARGSSDDKVQVFAMISAVDALKAAGLRPRANIKFLFDGEEEMDSPSLAAILSGNQTLFKSDLVLIGDSPEHPSGRQTVTFGVRGIQKVEITVYGPRGELHSGHYGNWAPNPAMMLAQLLASMKDPDGRVLIDHFYDGAVALTPLELQAIDEIPDNDVALMREFGLARVEGGGKRLAALRALPALNIRGMASARVGSTAANVIPTSATADLDVRVVKGITHEQETARLVDHIRKLGYYVTSAPPDDAMRLKYPRIAQVVVDPGGYDGVRTAMDLPAAQTVIDAVKSARTLVILEPTMGGSVPLAAIETVLGTHTVVIPISNYDNNQHSDNENLRLENLWNGIEVHAALMMMP